MTSNKPADAGALFRQLDRPLWIVTAEHGGKRSGLLAACIWQCSAHPADPLLLAGLGPNHFTTELIVQSGQFVLSLLASDQFDLAWRFGSVSGRSVDKFSGMPIAPVSRTFTKMPIPPNCLGWLGCKVIDHYDAGERLFFWAEVLEASPAKEGAPLTEHLLLANASAEQRGLLASDLERSRQDQLPRREAWIKRLNQ